MIPIIILFACVGLILNLIGIRILIKDVKQTMKEKFNKK